MSTVGVSELVSLGRQRVSVCVDSQRQRVTVPKVSLPTVNVRECQCQQWVSVGVIPHSGGDLRQ